MRVEKESWGRVHDDRKPKNPRKPKKPTIYEEREARRFVRR